MPMGASRMSDNVLQHTLEDGEHRQNDPSHSEYIIISKSEWDGDIKEKRFKQALCYSSGSSEFVYRIFELHRMSFVVDVRNIQSIYVCAYIHVCIFVQLCLCPMPLECF